MNIMDLDPATSRMSETPGPALTDTAPARARQFSILRHPLTIRITHWINVLALLVMLMSGLQIFNAHPALDWGNISNFEHPFLSMTARPGPDGKPVGVTTVFGHSFNTTGLLGLSTDSGRPTPRGFPSWATIP